MQTKAKSKQMVGLMMLGILTGCIKDPYMPPEKPSEPVVTSNVVIQNQEEMPSKIMNSLYLFDVDTIERIMYDAKAVGEITLDPNDPNYEKILESFNALVAKAGRQGVRDYGFQIKDKIIFKKNPKTAFKAGGEPDHVFPWALYNKMSGGTLVPRGMPGRHNNVRKDAGDEDNGVPEIILESGSRVHFTGFMFMSDQLNISSYEVDSLAMPVLSIDGLYIDNGDYVEGAFGEIHDPYPDEWKNIEKIKPDTIQTSPWLMTGGSGNGGYLLDNLRTDKKTIMKDMQHVGLTGLRDKHLRISETAKHPNASAHVHFINAPISTVWRLDTIDMNGSYSGNRWISGRDNFMSLLTDDYKISAQLYPSLVNEGNFVVIKALQYEPGVNDASFYEFTDSTGTTRHIEWKRVEDLAYAMSSTGAFFVLQADEIAVQVPNNVPPSEVLPISDRASWPSFINSLPLEGKEKIKIIPVDNYGYFDIARNKAKSQGKNRGR